MNNYPIVFVHGLMGWGSNEGLGFPYFGLAELGVAIGRLRNLDLDFSRRALFPAVGPISSHHDRACELFYLLKGGDVRYGEKHAKQHGHRATIANWRKARQRLYPEWDADHPIHVVGHSQGAPTIRVLQHLLDQKDFFRDEKGRSYNTDASWIRSLTSISGVLNGSLATYILGGAMDSGRVQPYSLAAYAAKTIERISREKDAFWQGVFQHVYNVDLEQWQTAQSGEVELDSFIRGEDNAPYDLSVHASQNFNLRSQEYNSTYYFSYITSQTKKHKKSGHYRSTPQMNLLMRAISDEIGRFGDHRLTKLKIPIKDYSEWQENDGLVSVIAQDYPRRGKAKTTHKKLSSAKGLSPGVWYVADKLHMDHIDIVALPEIFPTIKQPIQQIQFYHDLYKRLSSLD